MKHFARISNSHIAYEDHTDGDAWWFDSSLADGRAAMQILPLDNLVEAMRLADVSKVEYLNGKFCVIDEDDGLFRYERFVW